MSDGRTVWLPKDAAWWRREYVVELGEEFGAEGPAVLDWLCCEATSQNRGGRLETTYRLVSAGCFVPPPRIRPILQFAADVEAITHLEDRPESLRCRVPEAVRRRVAIPPWLRASIMCRDGFTCQRCGWAVTAYGAGYDGRRAPCGDRVLELDHVVPLALGGLDTEENLQALCRPCNRRKAARL
jgi:5-methylcytosine-specific restriction endonuclease McrA